MIHTSPDLDNRTKEREAIRRQLGKRLIKADRVRFEPDHQKATARLELRIDRPVEVDGRVWRVVVVQLETGNNGTPFEASQRMDAMPPNFVAGVLEAFEQAWGTIATQRKLAVAEDDKLIEVLKGKEVRAKEFAVRELGRRRAKQAVDAICALLDDESNMELALAAVGALIRIGDRTAVEPLIALARQKDPAFVLQIVFALGALGGPTAEGYLVTLASGHPHEAVRRGAEDALNELAMRSKPTSARP